MARFCKINNKTKHVAQLDGRDIVVSHPQLLFLAETCGLIDPMEYDTACEYPMVCDAYPNQVGLYIVALENRKERGGMVIGLGNKTLYLSLGFWDGTYFLVNGQSYHYRNVFSWLFICDERRITDFFNKKGRTLR